MIAKRAGYAIRLRSLSYGGQVGSNPPHGLLCVELAVTCHQLHHTTEHP
jgi:hypothetical protein